MGYLHRVIADSRPPTVAGRPTAMVPAFRGHVGPDSMADGPVGETVQDTAPAGSVDRAPPAAGPEIPADHGEHQATRRDVPPPPRRGARPRAEIAPAGPVPDAPAPTLAPAAEAAATATAPRVPPGRPTSGTGTGPTRLTADAAPTLAPAAEAAATATAPQVPPGRPTSGAGTGPTRLTADAAPDETGTPAPATPGAVTPGTGPQDRSAQQLATIGPDRRLTPAAGQSEPVAAALPPAPAPRVNMVPPGLQPVTTPPAAGPALAHEVEAAPAPMARILAPPAPQARAVAAPATGGTSRLDDTAPSAPRLGRATPEAAPEVRIGRVDVFVDGPPAGARAARSAPPRDDTSRYRLRSL